MRTKFGIYVCICSNILPLVQMHFFVHE
jgi:hypothetical protein